MTEIHQKENFDTTHKGAMRAKTPSTQNLRFLHWIFWFLHYFWRHLDRIAPGFPFLVGSKKCKNQKIQCKNRNFFVMSARRIRVQYERDIIVQLLFEISPSFVGVFARKFEGREGHDLLSKSLSHCVRKKWQNSTQQQNENKHFKLAGGHCGRKLLFDVSPSFRGLGPQKFDSWKHLDVLSKFFSHCEVGETLSLLDQSVTGHGVFVHTNLLLNFWFLTCCNFVISKFSGVKMVQALRGHHGLSNHERTKSPSLQMTEIHQKENFD